jgi:para-nitrobenzyl esterase
MQAAWVSFAKTGDPACDAVGAWPRYEPEVRNTLFIDRKCRVVADPDSEKRLAWARARQE